ncbi:MAG: alkaline phosphatase family protein [Oligoflexia bacterium]|nr:alkaline phosphatase family protein [Oligoflexia bacterium]
MNKTNNHYKVSKKIFKPIVIITFAITIITSFMSFISFLGGYKAFASSEIYRTDSGVEKNKHVELIHLDGIHSGLIESMLKSGQLPTISKILEHGKSSFEVSTVDKSETMKVVLSYLSSKIESDVVGWWQFNRDKLQFKNFWIEPMDLVTYALGLEFPRYPTIYDYLNDKGHNLIAGFSLHRRGVPFKNYGRAYYEGVCAVYNDNCPKQARATMDDTIRILKRNVEDANCGKGVLPVLNTSLLATADEFIHLDGVFSEDKEIEKNKGYYCLERASKDKRESDPMEPYFSELDELASKHLFGNISYPQKFDKYFSKIEWENSLESTFSKHPISKKICLQLPLIEGTSDSSALDKNSTLGGISKKYATPRSVLAMIFVDLQLERLVETLKETKLFDKTLFVIFGDHGMGDTKKMMIDPKNRYFDSKLNKDSIPMPFINYLSKNMGLETAINTENLSATPKKLIGIDDATVPQELVATYKNINNWQSEEIKSIVKDANEWANKFFQDAKTIITNGVKGKYQDSLWPAYVGPIYYLVGTIIDKKIDEKVASGLDAYKDRIIDVFTKFYLRGIPKYVEEEHKGLKKFYDQHVRVIYGGGARNNLEIFIPSKNNSSSSNDGNLSWSDKRPSYEEILNYKIDQNKSLINSLKENPGVGLIFIRRENGEISSSNELEKDMHIDIMDRFDNKSTITVKKDQMNGELHFSYKVINNQDPLGYIKDSVLEKDLPQEGTYSQWNDLSINKKHYYHNVVAGIGSLLYSNNPALGDILAMRSQGWGFGENNGGHGGIHREEKLTFLGIAGPEVQKGDGKLMSKDKDGNVTNPTLLDIAPTILNWLNYGPNALTDFSRKGFKEYLNKWVAGQKDDIVNNYNDMEEITKILNSLGIGKINLSELKSSICRLFQFMPDKAPNNLPDFNKCHQDGNKFILGEK